MEITKAVFNELFEKFFKRLTYFAMDEFFLESDTAKDMVVSLLVKFWEQRNKRSFITEQDIEHFLYRCTRNAAIDYTRKQKHVNTVRKDIAKNEKGIEMPEENPWQVQKKAMRKAAIVENIYQAIEALPPQYKKVIQLKLQYKSIKEIAKEMDVSESTVYGYEAKAIKSLKKRFEHDLAVQLTMVSLGLLVSGIAN